MVRLTIDIEQKGMPILAKTIIATRLEVSVEHEGIQATDDEISVAEKIINKINPDCKHQIWNETKKTNEECLNEVMNLFK